jgi:hypothetical protein
MVGRWGRIAGMLSALALATAGAAAAGAPAPEGTLGGACSIATGYRVISVAAFKTREPGFGENIMRLRGADVHVAAQFGLTREWLQSSIERSIARGDCDFGVPKVSVNVLSAGDGFDVQLTAPDERAADELLRQVQKLAPPHQ